MRSWLNRILKDNSKPFIDQKVVASAYPSRIIITSWNKASEGFWYGTNSFVVLSRDSEDKILGHEIVNILNKSKYEPLSIKSIKEIRKDYLKTLKFKTEKDFMENAKELSISKTNEVMCFIPYENRFSDGRKRAFYRLLDEKIELSPDSDELIIGQTVKKLWDKCLIT